MKTKEEIEKKIVSYEQEYEKLDRMDTCGMSISDMKDHYRQLSMLSRAIAELKWVIAVDIPTQERIKELAETYHDRDILAMSSGGNQRCNCCNNIVTARICIEHDSQDNSKDKQVCSDCYVAIATYWKEHRPKKKRKIM